jgi:NADP-reducing hydrogenase subunit HndB
MAIKSLEELKALRASLQDSIDLREKGESTGKLTEILVGMGTCGIAAGARDTFNALLDEISLRNTKDIKVISVGCIGQCSLEPTVQVNRPGSEPIIYGNITQDSAKALIDSIVDETSFDGLVLIPSFKKAGVDNE